jgi:DNA-binding transcriptional MerR regulator
MDDQLPDKLFFKIGEVSEIVGVKPHVLRYWETEFRALTPMKTRGAHRVYRRKDVELAMHIRRLVHDEGFTIPGARKRLKELGRHKRASDSDPGAAREAGMRAELLAIRKDLSALLDALDLPNGDGSGGNEQKPADVKVEKSVPTMVRVRG